MVGGEHSSKELFEQLVNSNSEHLHMNPRQYLISLPARDQSRLGGVMR
jgi:hypothetical protein